MFSAMTSFEVWGLGVVGMVACVAHGLGSSLWNGLAVAALTDTPWPWPTPAGAASASGGFPPLEEEAIAGAERAERSGGLHKRSAEDEGAPCARQERSS